MLVWMQWEITGPRWIAVRYSQGAGFAAERLLQQQPLQLSGGRAAPASLAWRSKAGIAMQRAVGDQSRPRTRALALAR
jgi:hypothetical protein